MEFATPLIPGILIRRYKRFLADIELEDGRQVTAHCANPGAMTGLAEPGLRVWLEPNDDSRRKLDFAWRLVELAEPHFAGIDTGLPNRLVAEALAEGRIPALTGYTSIRREVAYGERSRVDFLLTAAGRPDAYVEVKNAHLMRRAGLAEFPDCVTARGARHLDELARMAQAGHRAVLLYCVQRTDCDRLGLAADIDPGYARAHARAREAGVEMLAHGTRIGADGIRLDRSIGIEDQGRV